MFAAVGRTLMFEELLLVLRLFSAHMLACLNSQEDILTGVIVLLVYGVINFDEYGSEISVLSAVCAQESNAPGKLKVCQTL